MRHICSACHACLCLMSLSFGETEYAQPFLFARDAEFFSSADLIKAGNMNFVSCLYYGCFLLLDWTSHQDENKYLHAGDVESLKRILFGGWVCDNLFATNFHEFKEIWPAPSPRLSATSRMLDASSVCERTTETFALFLSFSTTAVELRMIRHSYFQT